MRFLSGPRTVARPGVCVREAFTGSKARERVLRYPKRRFHTLLQSGCECRSGCVEAGAHLLLEGSQTPDVLAHRGGVILARRARQLTELVRLLASLDTSTLMGLGGFPETDKQFVGMLACMARLKNQYGDARTVTCCSRWGHVLMIG